MTKEIVTHDMVWNVDNVKEFRGFDVDGGEVSLSDEEYASYLTDIYGDVRVCGQLFDSGDLFKDVDPIAFGCGKSDYESALTTELEEAIENEDDQEIVFGQYDPSEIEDEEDAEEEDPE